MSKFATTNYYKTINKIELVEAHEVEVIKPWLVKGQKLKFCGIPYSTVEESVYDVPTHYFSTILWRPTLIEILEFLESKYFISKAEDDSLHIWIKSCLIIDGVSTYFNELEEAQHVLSVLKSRCKESGNKCYKSEL